MTTHNLVGSNEPDDDATGPDPSPGPVAYLSIEPHLVEHGDIILGLHTPVASILTDGQSWFYGDDRGTFIAKRPSWGKVQVLRNVGGWAADPVHSTSGEDDGRGSPALAANSGDDCNPLGITRVTRDRKGLHVVPS